MRKLLFLLTALAALVGASASSFGAGFLILAKPAGGGGAASYAEVTTFNSTSSTSGTTWDVSITMTGSGGTLIVGAGFQNVGITGITFDPAGQNVSLTNQADSGSGESVLFSGTISAASGTKTLRFTTNANNQFDQVSGVVWLAQNLVSTTPTATAGAVGSTLSISATAGQFLFAHAYFPGTRTPSWGSSTETPSNTYDDTSQYSHGADWTVISTNASFSMNPSSGAYYFVAAQFH